MSIPSQAYLLDIMTPRQIEIFKPLFCRLVAGNLESYRARPSDDIMLFSFLIELEPRGNRPG